MRYALAVLNEPARTMADGGGQLVVRDADADSLRALAARAAAWEARALAAEAGMAALRRRVAALEERNENESRVFGPLPLCVCHAIFLLLPVDTRLRCREVSRGWHACLSNPELWQLCDLSDKSGVARRTIALLRAATKRALGTLRTLDVSGFQETTDQKGSNLVSVLLEIANENWRSLEDLRAWACCGYVNWSGIYRQRLQWSSTQLDKLLAIAPNLQTVQVDFADAGPDVPLPRRTAFFNKLLRMLRNEAHYGPLRLQQVANVVTDVSDGLVVLVAALKDHGTLTDLDIEFCGPC